MCREPDWSYPWPELAWRTVETYNEPWVVWTPALLGPSALETGTAMRLSAATIESTGSIRPTSDYATLLAQIRRTNLLDRSAIAYLPRSVVLAVMITGGASVFVWLGQSWWQLAVAAYFAVVGGQLGFLGHDAGHQQIFRTRRWNDLAGMLIANLGVGLSYTWWVDKHNRHHRNPNEIGRDPDVARNVLAWTDSQATAQRGVFRVVARHQRLLFFPLLLLEAANLHVGSARALFMDRRRRLVEITMLTVHVAAGVAVLLIVLAPLQALAFICVQQALLGLYLGSSFAPNHKGMPVSDGSDATDFLRRQVLTARNVTGNRLLTAALGGLNYQIEHHLFPSMPSRNLRRCQPLVKRFCLAHDISYRETGTLESYAAVLRHLHSIQPQH
jgi:fatty acid desaturase